MANAIFPIYDLHGDVLLEVERCLSALFGIVTPRRPTTLLRNDPRNALGLRLQLWIGKRSNKKQTHPGMLDCTAAGGSSHRNTAD